MLISLIIPVFNESDNLSILIPTIEEQLKSSKFKFEYVFVDDGSKDNSIEVINSIKIKHPAQIVAFSRNFGKEPAIYAGLKYCKGDAAIILDADMQHPPAVIHEFIERWQDGYDMVYGKLKTREHQGVIKKYFSNQFYKLLDMLSNTKIPRNSGDFRLLNRKVIDAILTCPEHNQFMKGLYAWVGFKSYALEYTPNERARGTSTWSVTKLFGLAINGITSFSNLPLRMATIVGLLSSIFAFGYGVWIIISTLVFGVVTPGFATIMVVMLFLGGSQLIAIGIVGEYIAKIFTEVKKRPSYIVNQHYTIEKK